jgi:hypothetical protein
MTANLFPGLTRLIKPQRTSRPASTQRHPVLFISVIDVMQRIQIIHHSVLSTVRPLLQPFTAQPTLLTASGSPLSNPPIICLT